MADTILRTACDTMPLHQPATERLIGLDPGCRTGRPYTGYPRCLKVIDDAGLKRRLRSDDGSVKLVLGGKSHNLRNIGDLLEEHPLRDPCYPGVFLCHYRKYLHATVAGKRPGDRMLPATTTYNENFHVYLFARF